MPTAEVYKPPTVHLNAWEEEHLARMREQRGWDTLADLWSQRDNLRRRGTPDDFARWCGMKSAEEMDALALQDILEMPLMAERDIELAGGSYRRGTGEHEARLSVMNEYLDQRELYIGHAYGMERAYLMTLATLWELYSLRNADLGAVE